MQKFGIDLSRHNEGINFNTLKNEGVEFAILRAGYTGYGDGVSKAKDDQFEHFYSECKNKGIGVGAYWFSIAKTYDEGVAEANFMYENCLKGKQFDYPIYTDVEDDTGGREWLRKAGKDCITDGICGFCDRLEQLGFYVGIYANRDWFNNWINQDRVQKFDKWLATWSSAKPDTYIADRMWQFGGESNYIRSPYLAGQIVDQDYCYYDYPSVIKNAKLNGFTDNQVIKNELDKFTDEELAKMVWQGKFGNGDERKIQLGDRYNAVQNLVNKGVGKLKSIDEVAKEVINGKWGNYPKRKTLLENAGYNYYEVQNRVNELLR